MGRTKQTARKSSGGQAPRRQLCSVTSRSFRQYMTSVQTSGRTGVRSVFINPDNVFPEFSFHVPKETEQALVPVFSTATTQASPELDVTAPQSWFSVAFASKFNSREAIKKHGRPPIMLTLVLDVSGSMSWRFPNQERGEDLTKLDVAKRCIVAILNQLTHGDSLAVVTFNCEQKVVIPPTPLASVNLQDIIDRIQLIRAGGGTQLADGLKAGIRQTQNGVQALLTAQSGQEPAQPRRRSTRGTKRKASGAMSTTPTTAPSGSTGASPQLLRRTMFLTDMESGQHDQDECIALIKKAACSDTPRTHTTVIGVGVDLSRASVNNIVAVPGSAYMSVATAAEFEASVAGDFAFDVMPLAFDISLTSPDGSCVFDKAFGSSELSLVKSGATEAKLSCEFPAQRDDATGGVPGSIRLFRIIPTASARVLHPTVAAAASAAAGAGAGVGAGSSAAVATGVASARQVQVQIEWTDAHGKRSSVVKDLVLPAALDASSFSTPSIRKAIALVRYVDLVSKFSLDDDGNVDVGAARGRRGWGYTPAPAPTAEQLRASVAKYKGYHASFNALHAWIKAEMAAVGDASVFGANGQNANVAQTINQVINLTKADMDKASKALAATEAAQAAKQYRGRLRSSKGGDSSTPEMFRCPITHEIMRDPVCASDGHTYEKEAIMKWLSTSDKSPMTGLTLSSQATVPNHALRAAIEAHLSNANGAAQPQTAPAAATATPVTAATPPVPPPVARPSKRARRRR